MAKVQAKFSEIRFKNYELNPDDKEHVWVVVDAPMSEERQIELGRLAADFSTDILVEYGYAISLMSDNPTILAHAA